MDLYIGIWTRKAAGSTHLDRCRKLHYLRRWIFINQKKLLFLGSGWLLDFPLAEMIERTEKICLIDIVHPPEVISQTGKLDRMLNW